MTLGSFIVRNTFRNKRRSLLTMVSISFSLLLLTMMICIWRSFYIDQVAPEAARRLIVRDRVSLAFLLPAYYRDKIRSVAGVNAVVPLTWYGGRYIDDRPVHFFAQVGTDPEEYLKVASDKITPPDQVKAWQQDRTGALVDVTLAKKYGWKIGDRIPLNSNTAQMSGSTDWAFDIVGTFTDSDIGGGQFIIVVNMAYLEEARALGKGTVQHFNVAISDPKQAVTVSDAIDRLFANSPQETKTESLQELAQSQMQSIGDMNFLIRAVVSAALVALLFATATMMIQSVRERTLELAVLKTVGFTDRAVFLLILAEALLLCVAAAAFGLALATAILPLAARFIVGLTMPTIVLAIGLVFAVAVALVSAAVPAALAGRLKVATALANG